MAFRSKRKSNNDVYEGGPFITMYSSAFVDHSKRAASKSPN